MVEDIRQNIDVESEESSVNLIELWYIVLKRWRLSLFVLIALLTLSSLYILQHIKKQIPMYVSKTKITLGTDTLKVTSNNGDIINMVYNVADEMLLLKSRIMAKQAASILKDKYGYEEEHEVLISKVRRALNRGVKFDEFDMDEAAPGIERGSKQRGENTNTILISAYTDSPKLSFDIVSAVLEGYVKEKAESETRFFQDAYKTYAEQLDISYQVLIDAENKLSKFIFDNQDMITAMEDLGLSQFKDKELISTAINEKYIKIKKDLLNMQTLYDRVKATLDEDMFNAFALLKKEDRYSLRGELETTLFEKEQHLSKLLQINEERHPAVIQARGEVEAIKEKMLKEIKRVLDEIAIEIEGLEEKENQIALFVENQSYQTIIEYSMLRADITTKRNAYNEFGKALHKIDISDKMKRYTEIQVLEPHFLPVKSEKEIPVNMITISILGSFASAIGLAYLLEKLDRSIKDVKELERLTHKPVLATIPHYRG